MAFYNRDMGTGYQRREAIQKAARRWIGTPFRHQARVKGVGCDCAGLVIEVGIELGFMPFSDQDWARFANYARAPNPRQMGEALGVFLRPVEGDPFPGDVCWLEWREGLPMHLAIQGFDWGRGQPTLIHALESAGRVIEHGFSAEWPDRAVSWWRYPGLII